MNAKELLKEGRVRDALQVLGAHLRANPGDAPARRFLFDLLSFSGEYDRAAKHLDILADDSTGYELEAVMCYSAVHAEKTRHTLFSESKFPREEAPSSPSGLLNGKPFRSVQDIDPTIGARLEVFAAGAYVWIPFAHISTLELRAPASLRDTLWAPALVRTGLGFKGADLGEVLAPAIYPFSWRHPDEQVWLGRVTAWMADDEGQEYPMGQRLLLVDGEEVPFLEIRTLEFTATAGAVS
jgi:type VI secretion system protein ImpE